MTKFLELSQCVYDERKQYYFEEDGSAFSDNGERAVFFARGVIETIKKLNWVPDVIHLSGWMASFIPLYLKTYYKNDSYFNDTKIILSVYNETDTPLEKNIGDILKFDGIEGLKNSSKPTFQSFVIESMKNVDLVIKGDEFLEGDLESAFNTLKGEKSEYLDSESIEKIYN